MPIQPQQQVPPAGGMPGGNMTQPGQPNPNQQKKSVFGGG
jgi:hypothetical protein